MPPTATQDQPIPGAEVPSVLPKLDGREVAILRIALTGGVELSLADADNRAIFKALDLDKELTCTLSHEDLPHPVEMVACVTKDARALKKHEGANVLKETLTIAVNREDSAWSEEPEDPAED